MKTHTPGPWAVRGCSAELPQVWDAGFDNCITDRVFNGNARLIAAAPELLDALRRMVDMFERHIEGRPGPDDAADRWDCARAAIEKAS